MFIFFDSGSNIIIIIIIAIFLVFLCCLNKSLIISIYNVLTSILQSSLFPMWYINSNRLNTKCIEAVVSCLLLGIFINKTRCSQPARRDFYPRYVRPFATRLVDNFCLFWGENHSHSTRTVNL